ncbi:MAG: hypothetical protein GBAus27B_000264 [Mycoplasmataceae bacterium]|nr:MAG: hypothetical protein GBAus27B_000264 [Mycoplasmataceae bacterium]
MTENTNELIKQVENQILETKQLIDNQKKEIANKENLLQSLINQLNQIKKNMNNNQNIAHDSEANL